MLLRRVIGDVLRARRQDQHRTLREVSTSANVSLGYLSEIERGQKEASSELLAAICEALGSQLSDVLRDASDSLALVEETSSVLTDTAVPTAPAVPEQAVPDRAVPDRAVPEHALVDAARAEAVRSEPGAADPVPARSERTPAGADAVLRPAAAGAPGHTISDGKVSVCVRRNGPLRTTLHAVRTRRPGVGRVGELTRPGAS